MQEEADQEKLLAHAVLLKLQGQWIKWCSFVKMDLMEKYFEYATISLIILPWRNLQYSPITIQSTQMGYIY